MQIIFSISIKPHMVIPSLAKDVRAYVLGSVGLSVTNITQKL